jgi:signal transduction histidine kinase
MLNHAGSLAFGFAMIALFCVFPRRLFGVWGPRASAVLCVVFVAADWGRGLGAPHGAYAVYVAMSGIILVLIAVQAWLVRRDPRDRAALLWVGLSVVTGIGSWAALVLAYGLQGDLAEMPEAYSFACFFLIYLGLALGVARFRLFDIADRAFWVFFYGTGAILFLSADGLLAWGFAVSGERALMMAVLAVAFLYLPLRDRLWRAFKGLRGSEQSDLFAEVIELVFTPTREKQAETWRGFLERQFRPVEIRSAAEAVGAARIDRDGLDLLVPSVTEPKGLVLSYPRRGIGLFSPRDVRLVDRAVALIERAVSGRDAYERGMLEERRRVARDLHDDVGARLLDALVAADDRTRPHLQDALRDVRSIAHGLNQDDMELDIFLATLRHESVNRLEGTGLTLDWPLPEDPLAGVIVSARSQRALASLVREALSNTLKHAGASRVEIRLEVGDATISGCVTDDGVARHDTVSDRARPGMGLAGLESRLRELGGRLTVETGSGVTLAFELPLRERAAG